MAHHRRALPCDESFGRLFRLTPEVARHGLFYSLDFKSVVWNGRKKFDPPEIEKLFEKFLHRLSESTENFRIVSNEVGLGIVPEVPLGCEFLDLQGRFNQSVASIANQVVLMMAGIPQKIK